MSEFTPQQEAYVDAVVGLMTAREQRQAAIQAAQKATEGLRTSGIDANDVEAIGELLDAAIERSGRDADDRQVKAMRVAYDEAVMIQEAVQNGMDPVEAEFLVSLGVDPRKHQGGVGSLLGGGPQLGGGEGEFQF